MKGNPDCKKCFGEGFYYVGPRTGFNDPTMCDCKSVVTEEEIMDNYRKDGVGGALGEMLVTEPFPMQAIASGSAKETFTLPDYITGNNIPDTVENREKAKRFCDHVKKIQEEVMKSCGVNPRILIGDRKESGVEISRRGKQNS